MRQKRFAQAEYLAGEIQNLQTADPSVHLVVLGDFNAFEFTDGYVDAMGMVTGNLDPDGALLPGTDQVNPDLTNQILSLPQDERYSFVFDGSAQSLDHILTSSELSGLVRGIVHGRGNADAADTFVDDPSTVLRTSDHDGLVLYLIGDRDGDGVGDDVDNCIDTFNPDQADEDGDGLADACGDVCPGTVIPEDVPSVRLGYFRYALVDADRTFDTRVPQGWKKTPPEFTLDDTKGCSCTQIADELHLGWGQEKFGCGLAVMKLWTWKVSH